MAARCNETANILECLPPGISHRNPFRYGNKEYLKTILIISANPAPDVSAGVWFDTMGESPAAPGRNSM